MRKFLSILFAVLLVPLVAQNATTAPFTVDNSKNAKTDLTFGTGRTLTLGAGSTLVVSGSATVTGLTASGGLSYASTQSLTAAQQATARANLGFIYSPEAWGVTGNGTTDDTTAMQSFAAAVPDGALVWFRFGAVYKLSSQVVFAADRLTVVGNGARFVGYDSAGVSPNSGGDTVYGLLKFGTDHNTFQAITPTAVSLGAMSFTATGLTVSNSKNAMVVVSAQGSPRATYSGTSYYDGDLREVSSWNSGTSLLTIKSPIHKALTVSNIAVHNPTRGTTVQGLEVDLTNIHDVSGIQVVGIDCEVRFCKVYSNAGTSDANRAAIDVFGINNVVRDNETSGILHNVNSSSRRGYGIHAWGVNTLVEHNRVSNSKHDIATGGIYFEEENFVARNNFLTQDSSLYSTTAANGDPLFLWAADVHDGCTMASWENTDIYSPNYAFGIRNGRVRIQGGRVVCNAPNSSYRIGVSIFDAAASDILVSGGQWLNWPVIQNIPKNTTTATVHRNIRWDHVSGIGSSGLRFKSSETATTNVYDSFEDCSVSWCDFKGAMFDVIDLSGWSGQVSRLVIDNTAIEVVGTGSRYGINLAGQDNYSFSDIRIISPRIKLAGDSGNRAIFTGTGAGTGTKINTLEVVDPTVTLANGNVTYGMVFDGTIGRLSLKGLRTRGSGSYTTADVLVTSSVTNYQTSNNEVKVAISAPYGVIQDYLGTSPLTAAQAVSIAQQSQTRRNLGAAPTNLVTQVASQCGPIQTQVSNGSSLKRSFRIQHTIKTACYDVQLVFANFSLSSSDVETGPGNSVSVTAGYEFNGTTYQVLFNGQTSGTISNGGILVSDPIPISHSAGDVIYTRNCKTVTSGQFYTYETQTRLTIDSYSADGSDVTTGTGAMANTIDATNAIAPIAIIAKTPNGAVSVLGVGDSIFRGTADIKGRGGFFTRAMGDTYAWANHGVGGTGLNSRTFANTLQRSKLYPYFNYAICELGTNDMAAGYTLGQMQTNALAIWQALANRGIKVYQTTLVPRTTSTDGFRTASAQSPLAQETVRVQFNDWVRTVPAPLSGYIEIADLVEANSSNVLTRNGGRWKILNSTATSGTATAGSTTSLTNSGASWTTNQYVGYSCVITGGTGANQSAEILSNTGTVLTFNSSVTTAPDATSTYIIYDAPTSDGTHPNNSTTVIMTGGLTSSAQLQ